MKKEIKKKEETQPNNKIYYRIFQEDKDGQGIITELAARFYDRPSYVKGDPYETAFKEGQRSVVAFLIRKCGLALEPEILEPEIEEGKQ